MELMSCTRIGTSETGKTLHFKSRMYVSEYTCSPGVVHVCAMKAHWREEAELQAQGALPPGIQSPVTLNSV